MVLPDYYKILQVSTTATSAEIKAAYRRLAKIYHPDKNPGGLLAEEKFKQIKEAYETLIHPQKRARYDAKWNRATTFTAGAQQPTKTAKKSYSFTEEEAKRRQYYQQQYKKTSPTSSVKKEAPVNKQPNELKYILISVPVAVALLLLIIRIYEKPAPGPVIKNGDTLVVSEINTPESPYKGIFGKTSNDSNSLSVIKLVNQSGYDAVVFLQDDSGKVARHHFIANNYQLLAENLAPSAYRLRYWLGKGFSYNYFLFDSIMGNFSENISVDSVPGAIHLNGAKYDTLIFFLRKNRGMDTALLKKIFSQKKDQGLIQ